MYIDNDSDTHLLSRTSQHYRNRFNENGEKKKRKKISIDFLGQEMLSESLSIDITDVYFTQDPYHFLISIFSSKYHAIVFILLKWYITSIMLPQFKIAKVMVIDITIWFDAKILIKISIN